MSTMPFNPKEANKLFKDLLKEIKENQVIVIYRHTLPDFDALGTQMGLVYWIKDNFPEKEVHYVGEGHDKFIPSLFPQPEVLENKWYQDHAKKFLAIVVDTGSLERISENNIQFASKIIKIYHHPNVEPYGNMNIVYDMLGSCAELVALFCEVFANKYIVSKQAAEYFYIGIVGDTGRFQYHDTRGMTLRLAADLLDTGIDIDSIYSRMYLSTFNSLEFLKFVLNTYKRTESGICYYVVSAQNQKDLGISMNEGKLHINTFRNVQGVEICVSVTEDEAKGNWRVSLRSTRVKIGGVASQFEGGGHDFASGCKLATLDDLPKLINALEKAIEEQKNVGTK